MDQQKQQQQQHVSPLLDGPTEVDVKQSPIKLRLVPAKGGDSANGNVVANLVVVSEGENGIVEGATDIDLPYIDETEVASPVKINQLQSTRSAKEEKPRVRYYAVGPSSYKIKCPLCNQNANACVMRGATCKDATCCLSLLSCIFPIFWLCCLCTWCGCNSEWHTNGLYCSQCGGKLGKIRKAI
ncbi:uncharacterized protein LOC133331618 [Musca vetustissima]|uniref:uncharacterized protein LOC133331618 n=1 Tax=Musca vetustissima TaxID=27455 RepID=UPI002AB69B0C|nr:uncharacterized protein LOC133331618 [Musca vetustissima]